MTAAVPVVSVAIPLFRSRRFVDRIAANIEAIDYPSVEIIVSDRHGLDDAIDVLAERFGGDPRVRFCRATDGAGWVDHYNLLLREGSGAYFMWMPHDDEFPPGYVSRLVACLEAEPEIVLAYGRIEPMHPDGRPSSIPVENAMPLAAGTRWSSRTAVRLLLTWALPVAFRGVFRRDVVLRAGLFVRHTRHRAAADRYWMFGLGLLGPFRFVPTCYCRKAFHRTGASHQSGPWRLRDVIDACAVARSYVRDHVSDRREIAYARAMIVVWGLGEAGGVLLGRLGIPAAVRGGLRRVVTGLMFGASRRGR